MELYINHKERVINVFAPVKVAELGKELFELGERFKDYQINTVYGKSNSQQIPPTDRPDRPQ